MVQVDCKDFIVHRTSNSSSSVAGWDKNHDFWKDVAISFFSPNPLFFVRRWGSTIFNVQYLPFTVKRLCSLVRCSTPNGGCSSRAKSDYLKENMHCSKDQWLFHAHCGSWAGAIRRPNFSPCQPWPRLPLLCPVEKGRRLPKKSPKRAPYKAMNQKSTLFYTFPCSSCEETLCCLWFNMCSLLLLHMRGAYRGRWAEGASWSS